MVGPIIIKSFRESEEVVFADALKTTITLLVVLVLYYRMMRHVITRPMMVSGVDEFHVSQLQVLIHKFDVLILQI
jgi:hypothetical protein